MLRFAALAVRAQPGVDDDTILDYLVLQKVLPRIHGSTRELSGVMPALRDFIGERLPLSHEKLARMQVELDATHFTAF